jgi:23S rRNA (adenine2030-N6)-methyltransferase
MNYRHIFHAGNFADVFKHVVLVRLLQTLHSKDTPFCYLDTHAGRGVYDLTSVSAQRSGEFRDGIGRMWSGQDWTGHFSDYLDVVRALNSQGKLLAYPGSPSIARQLLRAQDRMVLCEQQQEEAGALKAEFPGDRQVAVHVQDGYQALKAFLPPKERRGLVLIDPPYESPDEFEQAGRALIAAWRRWDTGIFALWYPIKDLAAVDRLHRRLVAAGMGKLLLVDFAVAAPTGTLRLCRCALVLVNPPWKLDIGLTSDLPILAKGLAQGPEAGAEVRWLSAE